jgi:hypothetical protein
LSTQQGRCRYQTGESVIDYHLRLRDETFRHDEGAEEGDGNQGVDAL